MTSRGLQNNGTITLGNRVLRDRPLLLGALSLALGVAVGMAFGPPWHALAAALTAAVLSVLLWWRRYLLLSSALIFVALGLLRWDLENVTQSDALADFERASPGAITQLEGFVRNADLCVDDSDFVRCVLQVDHVTVGRQTLPLAGCASLELHFPLQLVPGERIRITAQNRLHVGRANPGLLNTEDYYRRKNIHSFWRCRNAQDVERLQPAPWWNLKALATRFRVAQAALFKRCVPEPSRPFVLAIWLGHRNAMSDQEHSWFARSGTAHILAVSGVHMGIVFLSISYLVRLFCRPSKLHYILIMVAVSFFALMAGARIASMRAAMMIVIYLLAECFDRERDPLTALSLAVVALLLLDPHNLTDIGAQMSFLSIASLLIYRAPLVEAMRRWPRLIREALATSLGVQILPLPLAVRYFHVLPLVAPLVNIAVVPLLGFALWLCFLIVLTGWLVPPLALLFGHSLDVVVTAIRVIARTCAERSFTHWLLSAPSISGTLLYWIAALFLARALYMRASTANETFGATFQEFGPVLPKRPSLAARWRARTTDRRTWFVGALVFLLIAIPVWNCTNHKQQIVFLDVGHGCATVIQGHDATVLVDGGDVTEYVDSGTRVVAPYLRNQCVKKIDAVFLSHPDRDHIGGLDAIVDRFPVGLVVVSPFAKYNELGKAFLEHCAKRDITVQEVARGDTVQAGDVLVEVLHPPRQWPRNDVTNNQSLVLRVEQNETTVLLPGDIEHEAEDALSNSSIKSDVLLAPHHGSKTSSSMDFLNAVSPTCIVVSTGAPTTRRPSIAQEVYQRYQSLGVTILRTDQHGAVTLQEGHFDVMR